MLQNGFVHSSPQNGRIVRKERSEMRTMQIFKHWDSHKNSQTGTAGYSVPTA